MAYIIESGTVQEGDVVKIGDECFVVVGPATEQPNVVLDQVFDSCAACGVIPSASFPSEPECDSYGCVEIMIFNNELNCQNNQNLVNVIWKCICKKGGNWYDGNYLIGIIGFDGTSCLLGAPEGAFTKYRLIAEYPTLEQCTAGCVQPDQWECATRYSWPDTPENRGKCDAADYASAATAEAICLRLVNGEYFENGDILTVLPGVCEIVGLDVEIIVLSGNRYPTKAQCETGCDPGDIGPSDAGPGGGGGPIGGGSLGSGAGSGAGSDAGSGAGSGGSGGGEGSTAGSTEGSTAGSEAGSTTPPSGDILGSASGEPSSAAQGIPLVNGEYYCVTYRFYFEADDCTGGFTVETECCQYDSGLDTFTDPFSTVINADGSCTPTNPISTQLVSVNSSHGADNTCGGGCV